MGYNCQAQPSAVYVVSKTDVWVGGLQESVCHFNGTSWQDVGVYLPTYPAGVTKIWATPAGSVYVVLDGALYHRPSGGAWSKLYSVAFHDSAESWNELRSMVAFGENDIWLSGDSGHVVHWDGATWQLTHVAGASSSSGDLWAVGPGARAHFDGTTWVESLPD